MVATRRHCLFDRESPTVQLVLAVVQQQQRLHVVLLRVLRCGVHDLLHQQWELVIFVLVKEEHLLLVQQLLVLGRAAVRLQIGIGCER